MIAVTPAEVTEVWVGRICERRNQTWVRMVLPVPPFVLGAVPSVVAAMNQLSDVLYMPHGEMGAPDCRRGDLHRTQMELVAASTSRVHEMLLLNPGARRDAQVERP